ncbi:MAG: hypothetical protein AB8G15_14990 [Saprospiraceae bacterium]
MKKLVGIILILSSLAIFGFRIQKKIVLKQNVTGYLKRAADANTVEIAQGEIAKVLNYLEQEEITEGYTSIFWKTPNEDIGFWYKNLKASQQELQQVKDGSTLEKTNVLIKLRETLLDRGGEGKEKVTVPKGLSVYPNNGMWAMLMLGAFTGLFVGAGFAFVGTQPVKKA